MTFHRQHHAKLATGEVGRALIALRRLIGSFRIDTEWRQPPTSLQLVEQSSIIEPLLGVSATQTAQACASCPAEGSTSGTSNYS